MALQDFRLPPTGAVPKFAKRWGLMLVVLSSAFVLYVCNNPAPKARVSTTTNRTGELPTVAEVKQTEAQMHEAFRRAQSELAAEQAKLAGMQQVTRAKGEEAEFVAGTQERNPYVQQTQAPAVDPIKAEEQTLALEALRRERRRYFARPEGGLTAGDTYAAEVPRKPAEARESYAEVSAKVTEPKLSREKGEQTYTVREGNFLDTVLVNRLDSTFTGPVLVQVSEHFWSHDRHALLVPKGARVIGEAKAVNATGQSRIAIMFHRLIRPDDVAIDLDKFTGLNQIGEAGMKDKTNHHYLQIFGVSIALGVIGAAAQGGAQYGYSADGTDILRGGFGIGMSQASQQVLSRFLNIPPTVTIREGHRVKVWFTQDLEVPAYRGAE